MKTLCFLIITGLFTAPFSFAQVRVNDPGRVVERNVEYRANSKIDQGINKGLDKVEEGVMGIFKKKDKSKQTKTTPENAPATESANTNPDNSKAENAPSSQAGSSNPSATNANAPGTVTKEPATLKSYSKFDFVPGDKVIAVEDFMQDAIGDFPAKWNSSGSGEVVTIDGKTGHWLMLSKKGEYFPEYITNLPENATLQFDLATNPEFNFYSSELFVNLVALEKQAKDFITWGRHTQGKDGVRVALHPRNAGSTGGITLFENFIGGERLLHNEATMRQFNAAEGRNLVSVSFWRQKQRLRVYVNEEKIWDIPRAFQPSVPYNTVVFSTADMHTENDRYYISNLRLAVGAPDTRNKLITEGKFVTHGILFDTNSDKIKPESYGAMKDIANVLIENADVRVRIIGHTDADGDDASNLTLSKRRAEAVKSALASMFGIGNERLETDGKGESQPAGPNTTAEGKANNRRVEFIKL
ncbi:OmpA family protein [Spirosoma aureum]|uniref:OmpA family protein n=1 Tax=Spirosoma aureum TaxID=2692134 RepID=A0A6G9AS15_9BACT|nr:OmpA family protein [Spirosoma aureum]QIP15282.1 OmpA family protein [Spirosoma aureum]